jgi:hypothetical protein
MPNAYAPDGLSDLQARGTRWRAVRMHVNWMDGWATRRFKQCSRPVHVQQLFLKSADGRGARLCQEWRVRNAVCGTVLLPPRASQAQREESYLWLTLKGIDSNVPSH